MGAATLFVRAGLVLALTGLPAAAGETTLEVLNAEGETILAWPMEDGGRWCLHWNHSVAGFLVRDCFAAIEGRMMLEESHQPDFAAGLGHIPGRGEMVSADGGGYRIENINEWIRGNCLPLRVGSMAVNHRLVGETQEESLSEIAERQSVRIVLRTPGAEGDIKC